MTGELPGKRARQFIEGTFEEGYSPEATLEVRPHALGEAIAGIQANGCAILIGRQGIDKEDSARPPFIVQVWHSNNYDLDVAATPIDDLPLREYVVGGDPANPTIFETVKWKPLKSRLLDEDEKSELLDTLETSEFV